jgi:toxin ParE1/3/4
MKIIKNDKYLISVQANADLISIWMYTNETWSKKQADIYFKNLINEIENISNNPLIGKKVNQVLLGYFKLKVNRHLIFYKINSDNIIEVIRILHEKMDIDTHLNE